MVQKSSEFSTQQLGQHLAKSLGQPLSEQELSNCCKQIEIKEPSAGKPFWQTADATVSIYIILAGKVRLLDRTDNLIASVGVGASKGELTLFPEEHFQPYAASASVNLKLCYIPGDCLRSLIRKYPSILEFRLTRSNERPAEWSAKLNYAAFCAFRGITNRRALLLIDEREIGRTARCRHTYRSCHAPLSIEFSQLVIRLCLKGKAQLPEASGIQAI